MTERIIKFMLPMVVDTVLNAFSVDEVRYWLDEQIARIEVTIKESESKIDDAFLPFLYAVRELLSVE